MIWNLAPAVPQYDSSCTRRIFRRSVCRRCGLALHSSRKFCDEFAKRHRGRFLSFLTRTRPSDRQPLPLAETKVPEDSHFVLSGFFLTVFLAVRNILTKPGSSVYVSCLVADMNTQQIPQSYQTQAPGRMHRQSGSRLREVMTSGTALAYSTADHLFWFTTDVRIAGNELHQTQRSLPAMQKAAARASTQDSLHGRP